MPARQSAVALLLALLLAWLPCLAGGQAGAGETDGQIDRPVFETATLLLDRDDGTTLTYRVELATTPQQHAYGLMHRPRLAPDAGMLFVFRGMAVRQFWMKNTLIPLDMLFFDAEGRFVSAVRQAAPGSLVPRRSDGPAKYVLEINGGRMEADGIDAGTRLRLPVGR